MDPEHSYKIFSTSSQLPPDWDNVSAGNIFLSASYLNLLEKSAPGNMQCHFIGLFKQGNLCGVAVAQHINLTRIDAFVSKRKKYSLRDYFFRKLSSHVIVIGNNMLTGQNAYILSSDMNEIIALKLVRQAINDLVIAYKRKGTNINLLSIKDFNSKELPDFNAAGFKNYFRFCTQPNMIFTIRDNWQLPADYIADMNTKYRTQYNRARKKAEGVTKRQLNKFEIKAMEERIHYLYMTVAGNASFNTFHLPKDHFYIFKEELNDHFLFYGYFMEDELIGFNTLIKNGDDIDTYFLGYDDSLQKEKMLYLNMLYDMAGYAIKEKFKHVIFARSAMEIKSSVGAKAEEVYGIIKHTNPILNKFMARLFSYFDPKIEWKERSPFK